MTVGESRMTVGRTVSSVFVVLSSILMGCADGEPSLDQARTAEAVEGAAHIPGVLARLELGGSATGGVTASEFQAEALRELRDLIAAAETDGARLDAPVVAAGWLGTTDPAPNTRAFIAAYRDDPGLEEFGKDRADLYAMVLGIIVAFSDSAREEFEQHFASSTSLPDFEAWLGTRSVTRTLLGAAYGRLNPAYD